MSTGQCVQRFAEFLAGVASMFSGDSEHRNWTAEPPMLPRLHELLRVEDA